MARMEGSARLRKISALLDDSRSTQEIVYAVRDEYGLAHTVFHLGQTAVGRLDRPFVRTTYPGSWVSRYLLMSYVDIDPVAVEGFQRQLPFDWRDLKVSDKAAALMREAAEHAIGLSGFSVPVIDRLARRSLFSVTSMMDGDAWSAFLAGNADELVEIASRLHHCGLREAVGDEASLPPLSPREIECLMWTARGKDYQDIAQILGLSGHTVRSYLKSARYKLNCSSLPQAVARAFQVKLIADE